jgi:hypothetical protein
VIPSKREFCTENLRPIVFLFFSFLSIEHGRSCEVGLRWGEIPRHEIHFACRSWRQLPFTKTICVLLNGGDRRRGKSQGEGQNGFWNDGDASHWMKWDT